jgi:hypothetical protein
LSDKTLTSITLYGEVQVDKASWAFWYESAKNIVRSLGYEPNYFAVKSNTMNSGKIMTLKRSEKKLLKNIEVGDDIKWIELYSLPDDYRQASFDYNVFLIKDIAQVTLVTNKTDFINADEEMLLSSLKQHIAFETGEIYEMGRDECPLFYALKANPISSFKTLNVIKKL